MAGVWYERKAEYYSLPRGRCPPHPRAAAALSRHQKYDWLQGGGWGVGGKVGARIGSTFWGELFSKACISGKWTSLLSSQSPLGRKCKSPGGRVQLQGASWSPDLRAASYRCTRLHLGCTRPSNPWSQTQNLSLPKFHQRWRKDSGIGPGNIKFSRSFDP